MMHATGAQGYYFTGDGCKRDLRGFYTITGRVDDVINVSGHRVGTAEVESALASHGACIEAAVVGCPPPPRSWTASLCLCSHCLLLFTLLLTTCFRTYIVTTYV
jgi:acyl-coenzyme A synthetase/AMP-(fatty) acid ligase